MDFLILAGVDPITLAVGIGLSILAGYLLSDKTKIQADDKPTALATRGSFVPYVRGTRRVGYVFALAGGRRSKKDKSGGKGSLFGGEGDGRLFFEHGVHVLAVGPIFALHTIYEGGKVIFQGPITQQSHASGSTISAGDAGTFRIYWGEKDQPVDTFLANSARIGISSRWPLFCYIVWNDKKLGGAPRWSQLEYVIEGHVQSSGLIDTPPEMVPTSFVDEGGAIVSFVATNGAQGVGKFRIQGVLRTPYQIHIIEVGEIIRIADNAIPDQDLTVLRVDAVFDGANTFTDIFPVGGLTGADNNGTLQPTEGTPDSGVNLAHVIWEILFGDSPYGAKLDQTDWDIPSLETLGTLMVTENLRGSVVGQDGETIEALLGAILQDLGVVISTNYTTGLLEFVSLRQPGGGLPNIGTDMILPPLPEREQFLGERPTDSMVFSFQDRLLNWRVNTIYIDDTGQAETLEHKRFRTVPIESTVHFETAALIGNRRELEELTSKSKITVTANRDARTLKPGDAITVVDFSSILRVWGTTLDPLTGDVKLEVGPDWYGIALDTFTNTPPGVSNDPDPVALDVAQQINEVPTGLIAVVPGQAIIVPRIRANANVSEASIHISPNGTSFTFNITETSFQTGGTLNAQLEATGSTRTDEIEFSVLGPDIAQVLDLTADEVNWTLGRQLLIIGDEIMYVRSITSLGGGDYRANDVLRGRYCTTKATHALDAEVFIFPQDGIAVVEDIILQPDAAIEVKVQPVAGGSLPLASIPPSTKTLHGEGRKPPDIRNLQVTAPATGNNNRNTFATGNDITVSWQTCLPISDAQGAGSMGAGNAVSLTPIAGEFTVLWTTTGDVIQRTDTVTDFGSLTITNANLSSDFGGEPSALKAKVFNSALGFVSRIAEITITRV